MMFLCMVSVVTYATDYYVSSSGNDSANGLSSSTPWKSISKVNSVFSGLNPGDRILFNKGDRFYGSLQISRSGASGNPITFSSYGTGEDPVITGFTTISGWNNHGNGIYSKVISCQSMPNMVTVNGVNTPIGRWPNTEYLSIDSHTANTSITDAALPSSPDWTGAEVVIRKNSYIWDRNKITAHNGTTLIHSAASYYESRDGFGYFIQNDIQTLDVLGEWCYEGSTFYMFFGTANPDNYSVRVSTVDQLASLLDKNYITFDNINFEGANVYAIQINNSGNTTIQNCSINFTGNTAIYGPWNGSSLTCKINSNTINNSNNAGIKLYGDHDNALISNNTIKNTGLITGMGGNGDTNYIGVSVFGDNCLVQYNSVENSGYMGIQFGGVNTNISFNLVNEFNLIKNDGGGIYTYIGTGTSQRGQKVTNNIVLNGKGYGKGMPDNEAFAHGIYLDGGIEDMTVSGNTVGHCSVSGLYVHNSQELLINNNTLFDNGSNDTNIGSQLLFVHDKYGPDDPIRNVTMNNNILFARTGTQLLFAFSTIKNDISSFGTADYNCYAKPINNNYIARTWDGGWYSVSVNRSLTNWQTYSGQDKNSSISPISLTDVNKIRFEYNGSNSNRVVTLDASYIDVKGKKYSGTITLLPYTSAVLMVDPNPSEPPASPVFVSSAVENATPALIEMTYNLSLANIVPATSAFSVQVNSVARTVNSVSVSGTKVTLTLSSPVAFGNTVTVAYTAPSTNPLQTPAGGKAASISAQSVTNRVNAPPPPPSAPSYVSSSVENAAPSVIVMTYNLSLANIVPATSAFSVQVNSVARTVNSVSVSGTKVTLTLSGPVAYGNTITVAYTAPSANPLQTPAGGKAASISAQSVTNSVNAPPPPPAPAYVSSVVENAAPSLIVMTYNLSLANIVPATSAFSVQVNSAARTVNSVSVSGTKVNLTLSGAVAYGNTITVAYTAPSANPLQTPAGGKAASISAQSVTNRVNAPPPPPPAPAYVSSVVENAAPSLIVMTYNLSLANIVPATSAFSVQVNSATRTVNSVSVSGTKVLLTLASPVVYGNTVTVAYTRPSVTSFANSCRRTGGYNKPSISNKQCKCGNTTAGRYNTTCCAS